MKLPNADTLIDPRMLWPLLLAGVPVLTALAHALRHFGPTEPMPLTLELATYGSTLLTASAILYILQFASRSQWLSRWASGLAIAGVVELVVVALAGRLDTPGLATEPVWQSSGAALIAAALLSYLVIEAAYRDHRAGAFVLPLIAVAGLMQVRAVGAGLQFAGEDLLRVHWVLSTTVVAVVGYLLLGAGATLAARDLAQPVPSRAVHRVERSALHLPGVFSPMVGANVAGLLVLAAACVAWEFWARGLPRHHLFLSPIEPWAMCVTVAYAGHISLIWLLRPSTRRTAKWAAILFGGSTALFLGTMLIPLPWQSA